MTNKRRTRHAFVTGEVSLIPIMNLVCLLIPFLLYTAAFVQYAVVDAAAPRFHHRTERSTQPPREEESLDLLLMITDRGFRLGANQTWLAQGCAAFGDETARNDTPTVPLHDNAGSCTDVTGYPTAQDRQERATSRLGPPPCAYDFDRLRGCIEGIKNDHPRETRIVIGGENNIDYDVLIRAMDAARGTPEAPLFPQVLLSSGVS